MQDKVAKLQEIANRNLQDKLPDNKRAIFDELVARGVVKTKAKQEVSTGVPEWGEENPNLYGAYGAAKEVGGLLKDTGGLAIEAAKSLPESTYNLLNGLGEMLMSPMQTLDALGGVVVGGAQKLVPGEQGQ